MISPEDQAASSPAPEEASAGFMVIGAEYPELVRLLTETGGRWDWRQESGFDDAGIGDLAAVVVASADANPALLQHILRSSRFEGLVISADPGVDPDVQLPAAWPVAAVERALGLALEWWRGRRVQRFLRAQLDEALHTKDRLSHLGVALSAEKNLDRLLELLLSEGRRMAGCEGASLFLIEEAEGQPKQLVFKLAQNDQVSCDLAERRFPLSTTSLAGYVATTGQVLNLGDAYALPADAPYQFDRSFDAAAGYRTRELLVMPMRNQKDRIIGVLQFLNRKQRLRHLHGQPFDDKLCLALLSLASQAAVAIENSRLLENIEHLFEGFVSASVKAIEARDPVTSGHSFRVADLTLGLAETLQRVDAGPYRGLRFSDDQLRELRYAALLHDFGKVGVRERVLVKPTKLDGGRLDLLGARLDWQIQRLRGDHFRNLLKLREHHEGSAFAALREQLEQELEQHIQRLEHFRRIMLQANEPSMLPQEAHGQLKDIRGYRIADAPWGDVLLSEDDFIALSVPKGSLTEPERREIESHVSHTFDYLRQIPWTPELRGIPRIAGAHHEKLDGSGYPHGLAGGDIPVQSRMMAIADIYDALTARDRPYKKAASSEFALDVLHREAKSGQLDSDLVAIFLQARIYERISPD